MNLATSYGPKTLKEQTTCITKHFHRGPILHIAEFTSRRSFDYATLSARNLDVRFFRVGALSEGSSKSTVPSTLANVVWGELGRMDEMQHTILRGGAVRVHLKRDNGMLSSSPHLKGSPTRCPVEQALHSGAACPFEVGGEEGHMMDTLLLVGASRSQSSRHRQFSEFPSRRCPRGSSRL